MISDSAIGRHDGAPQALDRPRNDQEGLRVRQATEQRCDRELGDAEEEDSLLAVEVAEAAGEQQKAAEGEQVRVHDPRERCLREAEIVPNRWQRDVHDRGIEHDHQIGQAQHVERQPALAIGQFGHLR
jgi:hypothetical protein